VAPAGEPAMAFVIDDPATPGIDAILADDAPAGTPTSLGPTTHADSLSAPGVVGYQGRLGAYPLVTVTAMQQSLPGMAVADMHLAVNALSGAAGTLTVQATLGGLQAPAPGA